MTFPATRRLWGFLSKPAKKLYWWAWYQVYSRRTTWGVQWARKEYNPWADQMIQDRVFFWKSSAEQFWAEISPSVRISQEAVLWRIERGDYKEVLAEVNYA